MTSLLPVNKSALHPFLLLPSAHLLLPVLSFLCVIKTCFAASASFCADSTQPPALSPPFLLPLHPCSPDRHLPASAHHFEQLLHHIFLCLRKTCLGLRFFVYCIFKCCITGFLLSALPIPHHLLPAVRFQVLLVSQTIPAPLLLLLLLLAILLPFVPPLHQP